LHSPFRFRLEREHWKWELNMAAFKVLLVDDEEEFVKALAERLELRGFKIRVALNGERALEMLQDESPDVMVLDLRMPGIDGLEVLRRVKKTAPEVQVIILTGHGSEADRQMALRSGAFEHLQKPVDITRLIDTLNRAYAER
jgi:two-component system response regulator CpxR